MTFIPTSKSELQEQVRQWYVSGIPWIPGGHLQHLHWGPTLKGKHKILSSKKLNNITNYSIDDLTITVEAGIGIKQLQNILMEKGQWLPIDYPIDGTNGSVGGLIARGISGGLQNKYMGVRDQIIGVKLMRTDGTVAKAGGNVVKNVAGYDIMRLLCGSWGSIALITELTFRLNPIRPIKNLFIVEGNLATQEEFRKKIMMTNIVMDRFDWQKDNGEWKLRHLISCINPQSAFSQIQTLVKCANNSKLFYEHFNDVKSSFSNMKSTDSKWLIRIILPPSKLYSLLISQPMIQLSNWKWDIAAGLGCGYGWSSSITQADLILNLRSEITRLGGALIILQQPNGMHLPNWLDAPSKQIIKQVKLKFDPKLQLCKGRIPGVNQLT